MDVKLTLKLDSRVIQRAKVYANSKKMSLSRIVEFYLMSITDQQEKSNEEIQITPFVRSLCSGRSLPVDLDYKKAYREHLDNKYS